MNLTIHKILMKLNSEIPDETIGTNLEVMCFCLPEKKRIKK